MDCNICGNTLILINQIDSMVQLELSKLNYVKASLALLVLFTASVFSTATINNSEKEK